MNLLSITAIFFLKCSQIRAFTINSSVRLSATRTIGQHIGTKLYSTSTEVDNETPELKEVEKVVSDMHTSGYTFRIVVVGNGAILETTSKLGPVMKSSISAKTGGKLVTLASEDQSFEFHIKVDEVENIVFAENARPLEDGTEKIMRICRLMNGEGGSICSLILGDSGEDAVKWFSDLKSRYGDN